MRRDPELRDYKLVFLTDRTQLDTQLTSTFKHAQDETIHHADSVKSLKELLESDSSELLLLWCKSFKRKLEHQTFLS